MPTRTVKTPIAMATILVILLALSLQSPASAAKVVCKRYVQSVSTNWQGRLVLSSLPETGSTAVRAWSLCGLDQSGPRITPGVCQIFYNDFVVALTTGLPVIIVFRSDLLDANGLWTGSGCDGINNWGDVEPAVTSVLLSE